MRHLALAAFLVVFAPGPSCAELRAISFTAIDGVVAGVQEAVPGVDRELLTTAIRGRDLEGTEVRVLLTAEGEALGNAGVLRTLNKCDAAARRAMHQPARSQLDVVVNGALVDETTYTVPFGLGGALPRGERRAVTCTLAPAP